MKYVWLREFEEKRKRRGTTKIQQSSSNFLLDGQGGVDGVVDQGVGGGVGQGDGDVMVQWCWWWQ